MNWLTDERKLSFLYPCNQMSWIEFMMLTKVLPNADIEEELQYGGQV